MTMSYMTPLLMFRCTRQMSILGPSHCLDPIFIASIRYDAFFVQCF